jgi:4-oxalocrotonate tautomerase
MGDFSTPLRYARNDRGAWRQYVPYGTIEAEFPFIFLIRRSIMPYVNIKITREGNVTPEQKARLISGVTNLLADVLHKNPATTVVVIDEVPLENWGLGGDPILVAREKRKK